MYKLALATILITLSSVFALAGNDLAGTWTGEFKTTAFSGSMELKLTRDDTKWKAEAKFKARNGESANPVQDLVIDNNDIVFRTEIAGADVHFAGKLNGEKLQGTLEAFQRDVKVATGTWNIGRNADKPK
jgi:hypothetical protein